LWGFLHGLAGVGFGVGGLELAHALAFEFDPVAAGRAAFRTVDLLELCRMLDRLAARRPVAIRK